MSRLVLIGRALIAILGIANVQKFLYFFSLLIFDSIRCGLSIFKSPVKVVTLVTVVILYDKSQDYPVCIMRDRNSKIRYVVAGCVWNGLGLK